MEVVLDGAQGVPEGAVLSIKLGDTKRQAPAARAGQPFRFATACAEDVALLKVELLLPAAIPQVVQVDPATDRFVVDFGAMQVHLCRRLLGAESKPSTGDPPATQNAASDDKLAKAQQAANYLEQHDLVQIFQGILHGLLADKPADPWAYIKDRVDVAKDMAAGKEATSLPPPVPTAPKPERPPGEVEERDLESYEKTAHPGEAGKSEDDKFVSFGDDLPPTEEEVDDQRARDRKRLKTQRSSVVSRSKVDTLLAKLTETRGNLQMVLPFLPDDFQGMLTGAALATECQRQFQDLDKKKVKKLDADDLLPVIVHLTSAKHKSIGTDQARRFLSMFDANQDGFVYFEDFAVLVQFVMITAFLESDEGQKVVEKSQLEEKNFDQFLKMVEGDREKLWDIIPFLPEWLVAHVTGKDFFQECNVRFQSLDKDESGTLEPTELLPVIATLSEAHPVVISAEKCEAFVKIFDVHNNGVIMKDEFIEFAQFLTVMSFLAGTPEGKALKQRAVLATDSKRTEMLMEKLTEDPSTLPTVLHYLPKALVEEVSSPGFIQAVEQGFLKADKSSNGILEPTELFPVVVALCEGHAFSDTVAQKCLDFTTIFDQDSNGVISMAEFQHLACFIIIMGYLQYSKEHKEMMLAEVMLGHDRIEKLIKALKSHSESMDNLLPFLPDDLKKELSSQEFADRCLADFRALDTNGSGVLEPPNLMPVILQLSKAHHYSLTEEHAKVFVDIFDVERNGVITSNEFIDFARFMLIMAYLDTEDGQEVHESAEIAKGETAVEELLHMLERDRKHIQKVIPLLPSDIFEYLTSTEFVTHCHDYFVDLDKSKTGTLSPAELFPVVVDLSKAHPFAVDLSQCERFTRIFDVHGDGVVRVDEFLDLARFLCVMSFLHSDDGKQRVKDALLIMSDSRKIEDLLLMVKKDRHQVNKVLPFLPAELRNEILSEHFTLDCLASFNELDKDANGTLDPAELFPVVQQMSQTHHLALDGEHCIRFTEIFDDGGEGVITKAEFVNFARFLLVTSFLQTEDGQKVLAAVDEDGAPRESTELALVPAPVEPQPLRNVAPPAGSAATMMVHSAHTTDLRSPMAGHLAVDAEFYESKARKLSQENGELRERLFGLESAMRRLESRLEDQDNRLRHADVDLRASRGDF